MTRHLLPCVCSARIPVAVGQAGEQVRCPACGANVLVPRLGELARLEAVGSGTEASGRRPVHPWTAGHACLFVGLVAAGLAAAAAAAVQSTRAAVIDDEVIRSAVRGADLIDIYRARQAFARQGVERPVLPEEDQLVRSSRVTTAVGRFLWAGAIGGLAVALAGGVAIARQRARG